MSAPEVLSGEFTIYRQPDDTYMAQIIGNDEPADIGEGHGPTPADALEEAARDYMHEIGPARSGRQDSAGRTPSEAAADLRRTLDGSA